VNISVCMLLLFSTICLFFVSLVSVNSLLVSSVLLKICIIF
jgi:hypothetical protein